MWGDVAILMKIRQYNHCTCTIFGASAGLK